MPGPPCRSYVRMMCLHASMPRSCLCVQACAPLWLPACASLAAVRRLSTAIPDGALPTSKHTGASEASTHVDTFNGARAPFAHASTAPLLQDGRHGPGHRLNPATRMRARVPRRVKQRALTLRVRPYKTIPHKTVHLQCSTIYHIVYTT